MLEKNKYNLNYIKNNTYKFEKFNQTFKNLLELSNIRIYKLLLDFNMDKIFIE